MDVGLDLYHLEKKARTKNKKIVPDMAGVINNLKEVDILIIFLSLGQNNFILIFYI